MGRRTAGRLRELGTEHKWLDATAAMPEDEVIATALGQRVAQAGQGLTHAGPEQLGPWRGPNATCRTGEELLTHGFVVNEKRQKISKSDGKPQTADDTVKKYGADIVRLWVASENYQSDIPLSDAIFETISNQYRSMRNSLRYQLGNLFDFDAAQHAVPVEKMTAIDRWVLVETAKLVREVTDAFYLRQHQRI